MPRNQRSWRGCVGVLILSTVFPLTPALAAGSEQGGDNTADDIGERFDEKLGWMTLEVNPMFFVLQGYFFKVSVTPERLKQLSVGMVALSGVMPRRFADLYNGRNKDRGFGDLEIEPGSGGLDIGYLFGANQDGLHVSVAINIFRLRVERGEAEARLNTLASALRVAYRWYPFAKRVFFLEPAMALGTEFRLSGDNRVEGEPYRTGRLIKAAGFHIGVRI